MAITKGHGNPLWIRDETILALDLYFDCEGRVPDKSDDRIEELSKFLIEAPFHKNASKKPSFRNTDGVAFKLQNLKKVATGRGLGSVSKVDVQIIEEFGGSPSKTKELATLIREAVRSQTLDPVSLPAEDEENEEFAEGRLLTRRHKSRERNRNIRKSLLKARSKNSSLSCEMCGMHSPASDRMLAEAIFEAHHVIPLSVAEDKKTKLSDMALLCANCHRLIHRAICSQKRWLSIDEAKDLIFPKN